MKRKEKRIYPQHPSENQERGGYHTCFNLLSLPDVAFYERWALIIIHLLQGGQAHHTLTETGL